MLTLGFSPCPNDTFMFHALVKNKIDIGDFVFDVVMEDVESLNERALNGELDITKLSFATYGKVTDRYELLNSGSALGRGVGPLVVSLNSDINLLSPNLRIAIPGFHTTANFLFSLFFPSATNKFEMTFSEIESAVLNGKVDAGVIIHENRFTYEERGLKKIYDLGELWEKETNLPLPLGGIVIKKSVPDSTKTKINDLIRESIEYAFDNPYASEDYVREHSQEMDKGVIKKHIETYVNNYSLDLGDEAHKAIQVLLEKMNSVVAI